MSKTMSTKDKLQIDVIDVRKFPKEQVDIAEYVISNHNVNKDPFFLVDLEEIHKRHTNWLAKLPRVEPYYAIKCNPNVVIIKLLAYLGAGFDCASQNEIQTVLDLGISPDRIIFAHPCKQPSYVRYAHRVGVDYMTFDNELELYKMKENHPTAKYVLRIITDDRDAKCRLSLKFGADMPTAFRLVTRAIELGLDLVGVSFHAGSGQMSSNAFPESICNARRLFDFAREKYNHKMYLLDIGGGYPGTCDSGDFFDSIANKINRALDEHFPEELFSRLNGDINDQKLRIIAEPGTYYACSAFKVCVGIIAKRVIDQADFQQQLDEENLMNLLAEDSFATKINPYHERLAKNRHLLDSSKSIEYYINNGAFGSLNYFTYQKTKMFLVGRCFESDDGRLFKSTIWGPTCDSLDVILKECFLPELNIGDFISFRDMGAYSLSIGTPFNGIPLPECIYVVSSLWDKIKYSFDIFNVKILN